jgi:hypothetical protein
MSLAREKRANGEITRAAVGDKELLPGVAENISSADAASSARKLRIGNSVARWKASDRVEGTGDRLGTQGLSP